MRRAKMTEKEYRDKQNEQFNLLWSIAPQETRDRVVNKVKTGIHLVYDNMVKKGLIIPEENEEE